MTRKKLMHCIATVVLASVTLPAVAHGDEPHGDAPHPVATADAGPPRFETATDLFELAGRLEGDALTMFVNRFETNEPVLQAAVEVEAVNLKAIATYQPDEGSYVVNDAGFVQALGQPGEHAIVVIVTAGDDADLMDAVVRVAAEQDAAADAQRLPAQAPALAGAFGLGALAAGALVLRRRQTGKGAAT